MRSQMTFEANEKKLWAGYPHLVDYLSLWLLVCLILVFPPILYWIISHNMGSFSKIYLGYIIILCSWISFFIIGAIIFLRGTVHYILTNHRVFIIRGIWKKGWKTQKMIVRIEHLENLTLSQNFFQYIFKVGTIHCVVSEKDFPEGPLLCSVDFHKEILNWLLQMKALIIARLEREAELERRREERLEEERRKKQQESLSPRQRYAINTPKLVVKKRKPNFEEIN